MGTTLAVPTAVSCLPPRSFHSRRGFSLITICVVLVVMLGMLGLALDLGRMYVAKSELQAYVDAAALAGAYELDGTTAGIQRAHNLARNGPGNIPNRFNLGNQTIPTIDVAFSRISTGGWEAAGSVGNASGYRFMRVIARGQVPIYVLRAVPGVPNHSSLGAVAFAGQGAEGVCGTGCDPFSPDAPNPADKVDFGFDGGRLYAIKWAPHGQRKANTDGLCEGDQAAGTTSPPGSDRGYIDVGQGNGNSSLHEAIVNRNFDGTQLYIGDFIDVVPGNKHVGPAIDTRFAQDTDQASATWAQYRALGTGNGRRIIRVPINDGGDPGRVIGFATFFMQTFPRDVCTNQNSDACCAEFVAPSAVVGSKWDPADESNPQTVYRVKLFSGGF